MPVKPEYKVTLLGAGGVGKSALTLRIISGQFTPTYNPTIEDYYRHDTSVDGVGQCIVEILDTAGTEQFASMRQLYITNGEAFALVYSIDSRDSFEEVQEIYTQLTELKKREELTVVLVGNKADLTGKREVDTQDGVQAAKQMNNCRFVETSAKDGSNVEYFFDLLVSSVDKRIRKGHSDAGKSKSMRKSFRLGTNTGKRSRSTSQPDLRDFNSVDYGQFSRDDSARAFTAHPGKTARRRCVIM